MSFIGSDAYYTICAAALAILVLLLIGCQVKARRPPQKTPPHPNKQRTTAQKLGHIENKMKFRLQYQIENDSGKIIEKKTFSGTEKNIVPCLDTIKNYIESQIKLYERLYEEILPYIENNLEDINEELEDGKTLSEILGKLNSKPRYAAGSDIDRINRNASMIDLEQESSRNPYRLIGIIIIIILVLLFIASITSR